MAMAKLGGGIVEINGKMGGNIYRLDVCGQHVQAYPRLINRKPTPPQLARRNAFKQCLNYIRKNATTEFVARWQHYANNHPSKNKKGESRTLTWHQIFIKFNIYRILNDLPIQQYPPSDT